MLPREVVNRPLRSINGKTFRLSDFAGHVVVLNLWATWAGPCRAEVLELVKLHKEFKSRGVEVIGLSTETPDASAEAVRAFVSSFEVDYKIGWVTADVAIRLMQGRDAIPQTFIISRHGKIVKRFIGFNPEITPRMLRQAVDEALSD
jgi:peroxiredoxin